MAKQTFTAGQTLTAQQMNDLQTNDFNMSVTTQTANYTLVAADKGTREVANAGSAITFTVPNNVFAAGDIVDIHNINTGLLTLAAGTGMTLSSADVLTVNQWQGGTLYFTSASASIWFPRAKTVSAGGLVYLTGATFTTATSVSLPNSTFTSTYANYRFILSLSAVTADSDFTLRFRAGGSDDTTSNYDTAFLGLRNDGTASNSTAAAGSSILVGESDATAGNMYTLVLDVIQPQLSVPTNVYGTYYFLDKAVTARFMRVGVGGFRNTTAFDALSFISSTASSLSGNYRVYGYANS